MKNKNPEVSVIIPTYNRALFLPAAIRSVLAQTYKNFELLIVDDGSTDNTMEAVKGFLEKDKRIKYFYHDNKGPAFSRNAGIRKSTGDYIAFLDSDDEWFPEKIHRQLRLFSADSCLGFVGCNKMGLTKGSDGRADKEYNLYETRFPAGKCQFTLEDFLSFYSPVNPTSVMIKRDALFKAGLFDEKCDVHQDWELWIRLRKNYDFKTTWEPLAKYLSWRGGISSTAGPLKKSDVKKYILEKHAELYNKYPKAKAKVLRNIGTDLILAGQQKEAIIYFFRSARAYPELINCMHLLSPLLGRRAYFELLLIKKRLVVRIIKLKCI